jgi:hypothetical protein
MDWRALDICARRELRGVGAAALGEWTARGRIAYHLRRRVTPAELRFAGLDGVVDVRGTDEHRRRVDAMRPYVPPALARAPFEAFA